MPKDKKPEIKVKFLNNACLVKFSTYAQGSTRIDLVDAKDGEPYGAATVNLEHCSPPAGHVFIKDWSENEGILRSLVEAKVIGPSLDRYPTGYASADLCRLLVDPKTGLPLEETANQPTLST